MQISFTQIHCMASLLCTRLSQVELREVYGECSVSPGSPSTIRREQIGLLTPSAIHGHPPFHANKHVLYVSAFRKHFIARAMKIERWLSIHSLVECILWCEQLRYKRHLHPKLVPPFKHVINGIWTWKNKLEYKNQRMTTLLHKYCS